VRVLEIRGRSAASRILVGERLANLSGLLPPGRTVFVTDGNVRRLFPGVFSGRETIEIEPGEGAKTLESAAFLYREFLRLGADRATFIVGVGGGVVCDLTGFAASTFLRGLAFGYAPTTLLAQADAAIGGKTGVNLDGYKNMVGTFSQPRFVLCDPGVLATLPKSQVLGGLAEIVKHAAVGSAALFRRLESLPLDAPELRADTLEELIGESIAIKVAVVGRDETEAGGRRVLNFGHTLGHAFESVLRLTHGEAVSLGMVAAAEISARRGRLPGPEADRLRNLLAFLGLPAGVSFDAAAIVDAVRKDKKRAGGSIKFVFLRGIGEPVVEDLACEELEEDIHDLREHRRTDA